LGAPDYYDTNYEEDGKYSGTGNWDLMAEGTNVNYGLNPPTHNPRSKIYTYKWAQVNVLDYPQKVTIPAGRIYENAYFRIDAPPSPPNQQYLLIENKRQEGFDLKIPGQDLLIYKCTESYETGTPYRQNTTSWQRFYPISANAPVNVPEAGTNKQSQYGIIANSSCTWPGSGNKNVFNDETIPAMVTWAKVPYEKPISNITVHGDYITFDFMGGGPKSNFHIFLPAYIGCIASAQPGSISPVDKGNSFSFKVDLLPNFFASELKVTANNIELTHNGNVYTISNIQEDQIVRVEIKDLYYNSVKDVIYGNDDKITIYPNPTSGELRIESVELRIENVEVFDVMGKCHASRVTGHQNNKIIINISHLQAGIYFVRIMTDKGMLTKKIVKE
jgi:hypothetical protein